MKNDVATALRVLAEALATPATAPSDAPRWRTLAAEAQRRGMPVRALRDVCVRYGVEVRGKGKHQVLDPAALDAAFDRMPSANDDAVQELVNRTVRG